MLVKNKNRWDLCEVDKRFSSFDVLDRLLKKRIIYFVPNLVAASIDGNHVYVETVTGRKLVIELDSKSRRFVT
jgi:hypothetical protein